MLQLPKLCMFCGLDESVGEMDTEHFVPRALWDDGCVPVHMRTVPAHKKCNASFSSDNEYFRDILVIEEGASEHPQAKRLLEGKIQRKMQRRFGSVLRTLKNVGLRNAKTRSGIYLGRMPAFEVDWLRIQRVLQNVMKGIFFTTQGVPMPQGVTFTTFAIGDKSLEPLFPLIGSMVPWQTFGDDVFRCRYVFDGTGTTSMACIMQFYMRRAFFGVAMPPELHNRVLYGGRPA